MAGSNGHKKDCGCPLCAGKARTAAREAAEAEQAAMARDSARLSVWMAAQFARQGSGGSAPDVLRQALGPDGALRVLRVAGYGTEQVRGLWAAAEPAVRQASAQLNGGWAGDPDHDDRVAWALTHGATDAELARVRAEVREEYAGKAREAEARRREYYGLDRMPAAMGASADERGVPVQRSLVHERVSPLGSEV